MNAQDLKNSILQLAIQGKLVEQRKEEGTAKELIEEIKAEKERLIKEKKIKKEKQLAEITEDEVPFEIPEGWEWVRVGDVFNLTMGQSPSGDSVIEGDNGIEFHQGKVFFGEDYIQKSNQSTNKPTKVVEPNTILLCVRAPVGIINITKRKICIGRGLCGITALADMNEKFVLFFLRAFKNDFIRKATGTTFVAITGEVVKNQLIPLPPLEEQKRIVAKIEELMPYIEKYGDAYSKLEVFNKKFPDDMQKSILQYAIQGKLVEQREEEGTAEELYNQIQEEKEKLIKEKKIKKEKPLAEITEDEVPFEIPESWKWVRLGSLAELITKGSSPSWQGIKYIDKGLLFVTSENVGVEQLLLNNPKYLEERFNEIQERSILKKDDILTNIVGASIGRTAIYDRDELANINQAVCLIRLINLNINDYIVKYLNSYVAYKIMMSDKVDTARANISLTNISNFIVPLPPLAEQKRIVAKIEEMLPYCQQLVK